MNVHGYTRVSTAEQGKSGLGLAAQRETIEDEAKRRGLSAPITSEEIASGADPRRPILAGILDSLLKGDVLIVKRIDRLSRSLLQFAEIVDKAKRVGWSLVVVDENIDFSTPGGRAMANMLSVFAEFERDMISQRIKDALRSKPDYAYGADVRARARELKDQGLTLERIAIRLEREGIKPLRGGDQLSRSAVARMVAS
jgi:DNA invertase Pin-like site-specific DNA recombinase